MEVCTRYLYCIRLLLLYIIQKKVLDIYFIFFLYFYSEIDLNSLIISRYTAAFCYRHHLYRTAKCFFFQDQTI